MAELKHTLPITIEECYSLINKYNHLDIDELKNILDNDYVMLLNNWNSFLHSIAYIIETIKSSEERGLNIKELIDKGYLE